jgi:monoamine oxidase
MGSFSFIPVGGFTNESDWNDLQSPLSGTEDNQGDRTLYFAGEAMDELYNGYLHGAYRSGEQTAHKILGMKKIEQ